MNLLIGITTSPRAKRFLADTVASIQRAAPGVGIEILIQPNFADPGEDWNALIRAGCTLLAPLWGVTLEEKAREVGHDGDIHGSEKNHRGLQLNSDLLLRRLIDRQVPWFVTMQDDVELCERAVDRIAAVAKAITARRNNSGDRIGLVSFYSPYQRFGTCRTALNLYPDGTFYGDLCLLWRRAAAEEFLRHTQVHEAHDISIQKVFKNHRRWGIYAHSPCLAQHTGIEASARGATNGGQRTTMNYTRTHDAMAAGKMLR